MEENKFLIPVAIIIAGALIAWGVFSNGDSTQTPTENNPTEVATEMKDVSPDDHILGNPNAEIIMVEYSDLECPFCKVFYGTTKRLMEDYGKDGNLAIVFRQFPLSQLHSKAKEEAIATECAAELGGNDIFWSYLDKLFETTPSNNGLDLALLPKFAVELGLDKTGFEACLENPSIAKRVDAYYQDGIKAGVLGTPAKPGGTPYSVLVEKDGTKTPISGAQPYEVVKTMIEAILAK